MAGSITIKDSTTKKFVFLTILSVKHSTSVSISEEDNPGSIDPFVDNEMTAFHTIGISFELIDKGTYSGSADPGTTGTIWKQLEILLTLKEQPIANPYYTLIEDDDTTTTSGYNGVIKKIDAERQQATKTKLTGTLEFLESSEVVNY